MKILKISMQNINSLKGYTEIDFEKHFEQNGIFAITGSTGAGKTTILDAICASMYAKTPRLSNLQELMSKHTGEFFCETEFETAGQKYRSRYSLRRSRGKSDGNFQLPKMQLSKIDGEILESSVSKVPKKVEQITGLDFNRFTRSILLAQGNFDAFLKANESAKAELLEKMTATEIYAKISQKVFEKHKEKAKELEDLENRLSEIEILSDEEIKTLDENKKSFQNSQIKYKKRVVVLRDKIEHLKRVAELEKKITKLQKEKTKLIDEEEREKENFLILNNALKAKEIKNDYEKYMENLKFIDELSKEIKDTEKTIEKLKEEITENKKLYEIIKKDEEEFVKKFEEESVKITKALIMDQNIEEKEKQIDKTVQKVDIPFSKDEDTLKRNLQKKIESENKKSKQIEQDLEDIKKALLKNELEIKNIQSNFSFELLPTLREKNNEIMQRGNNLKILKEKLIDLENINLSLKKNEEEKEISHKNQIELQKEITHYEKLYQNIEKLISELEEKANLQAKIINLQEERKNLTKGSPCPLCGSTSHPWADRTPPNISETKKKLKDEKLQLKKIQNRLDTLKTKKAKEESNINNLSKNSKEFFAKRENILKAVKEIDPSFKNSSEVEKVLEQLRKELKAVRKDIKELEENEKKLNELQKIVSKQKEQEAEINLQKEKIKYRLDSIFEIKEEIETQLEEIKGVKKRRFALIKEKNLKLYENSLKTQREKFQEKISNIQKTISEIDKDLNSKEMSYQDKNKMLDREKNKNEKLKTLFLQKLEEKGIKDQKEFESFLIDEQKIQSLQQKREKLKDKNKDIEIKLKNAQEELTNQKQKNIIDKSLNEIENSLKESEKEYEKATKEIARIETKIEHDKKERQKASKYQKEYENAKKEYKNYDMINHLIGSKDGNKFRKFAQGLTLQSLINIANTHLKRLNDRYQLKRSESSKDKLDITVIDTYQADTIRSVDTLSGGESFIVSLALALALSDLVSHKIEIKSLFLDEGFGSLDQETLESVLSALNTIRNSGKMIGIISHVEALKERITKQIKVVKLSGGISKIEII